MVPARLLLTSDRTLDSAANYLATHPRLTAALLVALILVAGQLDRSLP